MKLLFDQNLSPSLINKLNDVFAGSKHVQSLGLATASDLNIWTFAKRNNFVIVTKDADFYERRIFASRNEPPFVVWIRRGNCSTKQIEILLRQNISSILSLLVNDAGFIMIR